MICVIGWMGFCVSYFLLFVINFPARSQFIVGQNDEGEVVSNELVSAFIYYYFTIIYCFIIGSGVVNVLIILILAYIFFPLDEIISSYNYGSIVGSGRIEEQSCSGPTPSFVGRFFKLIRQHPRLRNILICPQRYFFQYVALLFAIPLLYISIYFIWNLLVICGVILYFPLLFVVKCFYLNKFIKNVKIFNQIKTGIWQNNLETLSKFKFIYYLLENEFDDDIANEILDFIQPVPKHLWYSKQLENLGCGSTWHCFLKGLFHMEKKEKLHVMDVLHTHWHGELEDLIGSWVNTQGELCEVFESWGNYYVRITVKWNVIKTSEITDRGAFLEFGAPSYDCNSDQESRALKLPKDCEKVEWINTEWKQSKPWYRIQPIRF